MARLRRDLASPAEAIDARQQMHSRYRQVRLRLGVLAEGEGGDDFRPALERLIREAAKLGPAERLRLALDIADEVRPLAAAKLPDTWRHVLPEFEDFRRGLPAKPRKRSPRRHT